MTYHRVIQTLIVPSMIAFLGCGSDDEGPNQLPVAELTAGPVEGSEVHYQIDVAWTANDPDGFIDHYEYAVDPPSAFSEAEIAEGGPGVNSQIIPGDDENPTVTRVSKLDNGDTVYFDWVHTKDKSRLFTFSATQPDSTGEDTLRAPTGRFTGMHGLYVRAIDDDNAASAPDKVAFTATTISPGSALIRPTICNCVHNFGPIVTFKWTADDPDGSQAPDRIFYKLIRLNTLDPPISISEVLEPTIFFDIEGKWMESSGPELTLNLATPGQYVFALRAIDEAGAVEPFLEFGRNAVRFQAFQSAGAPLLTLSESSLGSWSFKGPNPGDEIIESLTGSELLFSWTASAEEYAGEIWGYSWGLDLVDPEAEGPESGWSGWSQFTNTGSPIFFLREGTRTLYVRARDTAETTTLGRVVIRVIQPTFDKEILYVDDSFDDLKPRDEEHDDFWRTRISSYGIAPEDFGEHHSHLDNDRGVLRPEEPTLAELAQYKTILWECRGSGYNGATSLLKVTETKPILASYLKAGGKLWLGGRMTIAATMATASGLNADLTYPKDLSPGMFVWDFLKIRGSQCINDKASDATGKNNLVKVRPYPGQPEIYPEMDVDRDKFNLAARERGVSHADAICDPELLPEDQNFRGIIEPLYTYGSTGQDLLDPPRESDFHGKLTALRWHDPDPARKQGRIQWFGFPLYYFQDSQAQETFNRSMDWFSEEENR